MLKNCWCEICGILVIVTGLGSHYFKGGACIFEPNVGRFPRKRRLAGESEYPSIFLFNRTSLPRGGLGEIAQSKKLKTP